MYEVVIAQASCLFADMLAAKLNAHAHVRVCYDSDDLLNMLTQTPADVLVLDMELPGTDGLEMVSRINALKIRPAVLATLSYTSDFVRGALAGMGVGYVMVIPCQLETVSQRVMQMLAYYSENPKPQDLLRTLMLPDKLDGTKYLRCAVPLLLNDPNQSVTKELYTAIGTRFGKNSQSVERTIRNAVHSTWKKYDGKIWQEYFGQDEQGRSYRPTNAQFLKLLLHLIRNAG